MAAALKHSSSPEEVIDILISSGKVTDEDIGEITFDAAGLEEALARCST